MEIQNRLRAMSVKRWNMVETIRPQSLAEHSFNVAMIGGEIAKLIPSVPAMLVYKIALEHDLEECILGDIPTPTKTRFRKAGLNYGKAASRVFTPDAEAEANVVILVKAADKMEAIWFLDQFGVGRHAKMVSIRMTDDYAEFMEKQHKQLIEASETVWNNLFRGDILL